MTPAWRIAPDRVLRAAGRGVGALTLVVLAAFGAVYGVSQVTLRREYPDGLAPLAVPSDSEAIAEGRRLAQLRGCSGGCHGKEIEDYLLARAAAAR
jgi:hypothetical protein